MFFDPVEYLSIIAVVFSALCGLFGIYLVLFVLAIWSTYRHNDTSQKRLRVVTITLFLVICTHFVNRAVTMSRARIIPPPSDENLSWTIPMTFIGGISTTTSGFISDGLLAWRFYVVYDRQQWALYIPAIAIILNAMLGLSGDMQHLTIYHNPTLYNNHLRELTFQITAAWGWVMFGINTFLTGSILGRIIHISRSTNKQTALKRPYTVAIEAVVESALVTWVGLLLFEIASFAPNGHITTNLDVGFVMVCIIPVFFGISQCLITVRLGFATETRIPVVANNPKDSRTETYGPGHCSGQSSTGSNTLAREIASSISRDSDTVMQEKELDILTEEIHVGFATGSTHAL